MGGLDEACATQVFGGRRARSRSARARAPHRRVGRLGGRHASVHACDAVYTTTPAARWHLVRCRGVRPMAGSHSCWIQSGTMGCRPMAAIHRTVAARGLSVLDLSHFLTVYHLVSEARGHCCGCEKVTESKSLALGWCAGAEQQAEGDDRAAGALRGAGGPRAVDWEDQLNCHLQLGCEAFPSLPHIYRHYLLKRDAVHPELGPHLEVGPEASAAVLAPRPPALLQHDGCRREEVLECAAGDSQGGEDWLSLR